jgi:F-type H+-transporting ATPase subunit a
MGQGLFASAPQENPPKADSALTEHAVSKAEAQMPLAFAEEDAAGNATVEGEEHAAAPAAHVSPKPYILFRIPIGVGPGMPVTNSMVTGWVISLLLIVVLRLVIGKAGIIPKRGQAIVESVVGGMRDLFESIVGKQMIGRTFPLLIGFFIFILIQNWSSLLPGMGAFGIVEHTAHGDHLKYWMRPANTDMSMTLGLACVHFIAWTYFVMRFAGPKHVFQDLFGNKADKKEVPAAIYYPLFVIFFMVGCIEVFSIALRLVSLSVRLYGNSFGGESLMTSVSGAFAWILPVPFMLLETLIGLVQALVFALLVAVYIGLICNKDEEQAEHAH